MIPIRLSFCVAIFLLLPWRVCAQSIPLVSINPSSQVADPPGPGQYFGFNEAHEDGMLGWGFTLLQPVTVTQIGFYDEGQDGLSRACQVGLWGAAGQLLGQPTAGITIPQGDAAPLSGVWRVVDLPLPLELQPGDYAIAFLDSATSSDAVKFVAAYDLDLTVTDSRLTIGGALTDPNFGNHNYFHPPLGGLEWMDLR